MSPGTAYPRYLALHETGELRARAEGAMALLADCTFCPRECHVNRLAAETGFCGLGENVRLASFGPHFGEEAVLVGEGGSGAVFFSGCNLNCVFCQNEEISSCPETGEEGGPEGLASVFLHLQAKGCANLNLVSPSHVVPQVLMALAIGAGSGLTLPVVYNTGGYDSVSTLALLDGVVDIYLPDVKFWTQTAADRFCNAADYPEVARAALRVMHAQVGDLELDETGLAFSGLLVRHLVLPGGLAGTHAWMHYLALELSKDTYVNLMDQYHPCHRAEDYPELARALYPEEYALARREAEAAGIRRFDERARGAHFPARLVATLRDAD